MKRLLSLIIRVGSITLGVTMFIYDDIKVSTLEQSSVIRLIKVLHKLGLMSFEEYWAFSEEGWVLSFKRQMKRRNAGWE